MKPDLWSGTHPLGFASCTSCYLMCNFLLPGVWWMLTKCYLKPLEFIIGLKAWVIGWFLFCFNYYCFLLLRLNFLFCNNIKQHFMYLFPSFINGSLWQNSKTRHGCCCDQDAKCFHPLSHSSCYTITAKPTFLHLCHLLKQGSHHHSLLYLYSSVISRMLYE